MSKNAKMPFTAHLEELRRRLIYCFIAVALGGIISYLFKEQMIKILSAPLIKALQSQAQKAGHKSDILQTLIFTGPHEAFVSYIKLAFMGGLVLAIPVIMFHLWRFIAPGLYEQERKYLFPVLFFSTIFFAIGILFGYFVVFPFGMKFFVSFSSSRLMPLIRMKEYISFTSKFLFAFGIVFELPLFSLILTKLRIINAKLLRTYRKYAILFIFILAAILTPPDVMTQIMMAGPLLVLFEISILISQIFGTKKKETTEEKGLEADA